MDRFGIGQLQGLPGDGRVAVEAVDQKIAGRGRKPFTAKPTPLVKSSRPAGLISPGSVLAISMGFSEFSGRFWTSTVETVLVMLAAIGLNGQRGRHDLDALANRAHFETASSSGNRRRPYPDVFDLVVAKPAAVTVTV